LSAAPKVRHFESITAQEKMLMQSRIPRTVSATGPELWNISESALELAAGGGPSGAAASCRKRASVSIGIVMSSLLRWLDAKRSWVGTQDG